MVTKQEIQTLLNEAIKPLERKIDIMTTNVVELKKSVEFLDQKYEDVLSQLRLANEKYMQQSRKLNELESAFENVFMGIIPDMLPNKIYINLKSELTLENKQLPLQHLFSGMISQVLRLKKPKCLQILKKIKTLSAVRATF